MIDLDKEKYFVIDELIDRKTADLFANYFIVKRNVAQKFFETQYIHPEEQAHGRFNDTQVPGSFSLYGDPLFDTHMLVIKPELEKSIGKKLIEMYTYGRVYAKGNELLKHTDRKSCEISLTMNLGGDPWPIFADGNSVDLNPGDCLVYKGCEIEHWREPFQGEICVQVFYHYNPDTPENRKNINDSREFIGLPSDYKINEN